MRYGVVLGQTIDRWKVSESPSAAGFQNQQRDFGTMTAWTSTIVSDVAAGAKGQPAKS